MLEGAAGFVVWAGASLVVLADGRRGLGLGIVLTAAGLGGVAWQTAGPIAAGALVVGGVVAGAGRLRAGLPGWHVMPPDSTPRIVLCVATALLSLWLALVVTTGPGAALRFGAFVCLVLAPARVLWSDDPPVGLTAAGVLALAAGVASASGSSPIEPWTFLAAAAAAASIAWLPVKERHAG